MSRLTRDDAIRIAWNLDILADRNAPEPTAAEALATLRVSLKNCGHNWITGQDAVELLEREIASGE